MSSRLMTVADVCADTRLSRKELGRYMNGEKLPRLPYLHLGDRAIRIERRDYEAWAERLAKRARIGLGIVSSGKVASR